MVYLIESMNFSSVAGLSDSGQSSAGCLGFGAMGIERRLCRIIAGLATAALLLPAVPLEAAGKRPVGGAAKAAGPALPDKVSCVLDAMPQEDREIALILMIDELQRGGDGTNSPRTDEIDRLLRLGEGRCVDAWPWTAGKSGSSIAYAAAALYHEANMQAVSNTGHDPAVVERWFAENRAQVLKSRNPARLWAPALQKHLKDLAWGEKDAPAVGFATLLLADLVTLALIEQDFARGVYVDRSE